MVNDVLFTVTEPLLSTAKPRVDEDRLMITSLTLAVTATGLAVLDPKIVICMPVSVWFPGKKPYWQLLFASNVFVQFVVPLSIVIALVPGMVACKFSTAIVEVLVTVTVCAEPLSVKFKGDGVAVIVAVSGLVLFTTFNTLAAAGW